MISEGSEAALPQPRSKRSNLLFPSDRRLSAGPSSALSRDSRARPLAYPLNIPSLKAAGDRRPKERGIPAQRARNRAQQNTQQLGPTAEPQKATTFQVPAEYRTAMLKGPLADEHFLAEMRHPLG